MEMTERQTDKRFSAETNHIMLVKTRLKQAVGLWISALSYRHWL
jgi:hypothetical protein